MSANTTDPTSPYRSYATPPATPSPSNPTTTSTAADATPAPQPHRHPRRTAYNPSRPMPTLRREKSLFGEESELGSMVLASAGFDRVGVVQLGEGSSNGREELTESQLGEVGVQNGWMIAPVGEDNGSQFTQGSAASQLFDSQSGSQSLFGNARTLSPYQLPSAPILRPDRSSSRQSSVVSPTRPGSRRPITRSSAASAAHGTGSPLARGGFTRQATGLGGMLEDGEE